MRSFLRAGGGGGGEDQVEILLLRKLTFFVDYESFEGAKLFPPPPHTTLFATKQHRFLQETTFRELWEKSFAKSGRLVFAVALLINFHS
jgi:hypothetical protein